MAGWLGNGDIRIRERVRLYIDDHRLTSNEARDIGRALLDAADYADGKVTE